MGVIKAPLALNWYRELGVGSSLVPKLPGMGMRLVNDGLSHVLPVDIFVSEPDQCFCEETITSSLDLLSKIVTTPS